MVFLNNKKFEIFDLDTEDTLLNRISLELDTLPKFLIFNDFHASGMNQSEKLKALLKLKDADHINIDVLDVIGIIRKSVAKKKSFTSWYNKYSEKISGLDVINDVLKYYIAFGESELPEEYILGYLYSVTEEVKKMKLVSNDVNLNRIITQFWEERVSIVNDFSSLVKSNNNRYIESINIVKEYGKIGKGVVSSEFFTEKIKYTLILDIDLPLIEFFNVMELDEFTPFATTNNVYKFVNNVVIPNTWSLITINDEAIVLKMLQKKENVSVISSDFTDIIIFTKDNNIHVSFLLNIDETNVLEEYFSNRFFNTIRKSIGDIRILEREVTELNGVFVFPFQTLKKNVFLDLIMNDDVYSSILSVNENVKTSKKRKGIFATFLNRGDKVSSSIVASIIDKKTIRTMFKYNKNFKISDYYVKVKVSKAKDYEVVERFKGILSKLFVIYNNKCESIVSFYSEYVHNFAKEEAVSREDMSETKIGLREIAPDIYGPNYTRVCRYNPEVIDDDLAEEEKSKGNEVIVFPKSSEESTQRNYICNYSNHIYPGLMNNPFNNKDKFPYIPCCFMKNQKNISGSKYKTYYEGEKQISSGFKQQNLYTTNKIIPKGASGTLPDKINDMFRVIDDIELDNYIYVRKGVARNKSSFLSGVLEAMRIDDGNIIDLDTEHEIDEYIRLKRLSLATRENASLCKQEMYDYSENEIVEMIKNVNVYFDPKLFINMIQVRYKCNIFIFSNTGMILPRYTQNYIRSKNNHPCILMYEHIGSQSNRAEYPQNDIIFKWKITDANDQTFKFEQNSLTYQGADRMFTELSKTYSLNYNSPVFIDVETYLHKIPVISQKFDSYGKTRLIKTLFEDKEITLLTTPLPPFAVHSVYSLNKPIENLDIDTLLKFVDSVGITLVSKVVDDKSQINEVSGYIGPINLIIPIAPIIASATSVTELRVLQVLELKNVNETTCSLLNTSLLQTYNRNNRLARFISEYALWLFSIFIRNKSIDNINDDTINLFLLEHVKVDTSFKYDHSIPKTFSLTTYIIDDKNKLICSSEKMVDKLRYILKLESVRYLDKVTNYHRRKYIESVYLDISDFIPRSNQVILLGQNALENYIKSNTFISTDSKIEVGYFTYIKDSIQTDTTRPYIFKNLLIDNKVFLAQNTDSITKALEIGIVWKTNGFNLGETAPGQLTETPSFTLYSYENNTTITPYIIVGVDNEYDIKVIGYKDEDDNSLYTVLL